jgi:hypothetical protein
VKNKRKIRTNINRRSSGDGDEDAGSGERDDAVGASAPIVSRWRCLRRARGADAMRATKVHKRRRIPLARWWCV